MYEFKLLTEEEAKDIIDAVNYKVCKLKVGTSFGDVALRAAGIRRTATIICCKPCVFLELEKVIYRKYM